ncbi:MAG: branched-chain amino acid ABC transporter permease [Anaerolineae bacterium]
MPSLQQLTQYFITGVTNGSVYALIALGFVTIFTVTEVINFAQGEFVMLGSMLTISIMRVGLPLPVAAALGILLVALLSGAFYWTSLRTARRASLISLLVITIGASIVIRGVSLIIWGTEPYTLAPFTAGAPLTVFSAIMRLQSVWVLVTTVIVLAATGYFFNRSRTGQAMRAVAMNRQAAEIFGIVPSHMAFLAFVIAGAIAAIAGVVIAPLSFATYDMGLAMGLKGFAAAAVGGLTNPAIAVMGGLLLGILEAFGAGLLPSGYKDGIAVGILLAVLIYQGLRHRGQFWAVAER